MVMEEPKVEFIPIDLTQTVMTVSCADNITDGGTYCVDSSVTEDCGTPMASTADNTNGFENPEFYE